MQGALFHCFSQGMSEMSRDLGRDVPGFTHLGRLEKLYSRKLWAGFPFPTEGKYGLFSQSLRLPEDVDVEKINVGYEDGYLRIKLPKMRREARRPRTARGLGAFEGANLQHCWSLGGSPQPARFQPCCRSSGGIGEEKQKEKKPKINERARRNRKRQN